MNRPWYVLPLLGVATLAMLWITWKISRFLMKVAALALMLGLAALVLWYLFLR